jgi:hypothetical protein
VTPKFSNNRRRLLPHGQGLGLASPLILSLAAVAITDRKDLSLAFIVPLVSRTGLIARPHRYREVLQQSPSGPSSYVPEGQRILAGDEITGKRTTVVSAPWQGAGRALYPCGVLRPARAHWFVSPSPVVSPPANILSPFRDRLFRCADAPGSLPVGSSARERAKLKSDGAPGPSPITDRKDLSLAFIVPLVSRTRPHRYRNVRPGR